MFDGMLPHESSETIFGFALFDLLPNLPGLLHASVLLGLGAAFLISVAVVFRNLVVPDQFAARRRIELASGLQHRPLEALVDRPSGLLDSHQYLPYALMLVAQVITIAALGKAAWMAFFRPAAEGHGRLEPLRPGMLAGLTSLAGCCVVFGAFPQFFLQTVMAPAHPKNSTIIAHARPSCSVPAKPKSTLAMTKNRKMNPTKARASSMPL